MAKVSEIAKYVWQSPAWPNFKFSRAALADELSLFTKAFADAKRALKKPQPLEDVASAMTEEAVRTSAIEGVEVDESVVMSSICRALGVTYAPSGFPRDARAEGVAQMMLSVRRDWDKPLSVELLKDWHGSLLANDPRGLTAGAFRDGPEPMRVVRLRRDGNPLRGAAQRAGAGGNRPLRRPLARGSLKAGGHRAQGSLHASAF